MATRYDSNMELISAAGKGDLGRVQELLHEGADPNTQDVLDRSTPLQAAAASGHVEVARTLVRHGADVNLVAGDAPQTALEMAAIAGSTDVVAWLLQAGGHVPDGTCGDELIAEVENAGDHRMAELLRDALARQRASTAHP